jgi:heptaprenyl diphosphate synthase
VCRYGIVEGVVSTGVGGSSANNAGALTSIGIDFEDADLESSVRATLAGVEDQLREAVMSADTFVTEAARHVVSASGRCCSR